MQCYSYLLQSDTLAHGRQLYEIQFLMIHFRSVFGLFAIHFTSFLNRFEAVPQLFFAFLWHYYLHEVGFDGFVALVVVAIVVDKVVAGVCLF